MQRPVVKRLPLRIDTLGRALASLIVLGLCASGSLLHAAIAAEETVTGTALTGNVTLPSWTPGSNELILLAVAVRDETVSVSASGNGLTFVTILDVDNTQSQGGITLLRAMGASPTTGLDHRDAHG